MSIKLLVENYDSIYKNIIIPNLLLSDILEKKYNIIESFIIIKQPTDYSNFNLNIIIEINMLLDRIKNLDIKSLLEKFDIEKKKEITILINNYDNIVKNIDNCNEYVKNHKDKHYQLLQTHFDNELNKLITNKKIELQKLNLELELIHNDLKLINIKKLEYEIIKIKLENFKTKNILNKNDDFIEPFNDLILLFDTLIAIIDNVSDFMITEISFTTINNYDIIQKCILSYNTIDNYKELKKIVEIDIDLNIEKYYKSYTLSAFPELSELNNINIFNNIRVYNYDEFKNISFNELKIIQDLINKNIKKKIDKCNEIYLLNNKTVDNLIKEEIKKVEIIKSRIDSEMKNQDVENLDTTSSTPKEEYDEYKEYFISNKKVINITNIIKLIENIKKYKLKFESQIYIDEEIIKDYKDPNLDAITTYINTQNNTFNTTNLDQLLVTIEIFIRLYYYNSILEEKYLSYQYKTYIFIFSDSDIDKLPNADNIIYEYISDKKNIFSTINDLLQKIDTLQVIIYVYKKDLIELFENLDTSSINFAKLQIATFGLDNIGKFDNLNIINYLIDQTDKDNEFIKFNKFKFNRDKSIIWLENQPDDFLKRLKNLNIYKLYDLEL